MGSCMIDLEKLAENSSSDEEDDGPKYQRLYPPPSTGGGTSATPLQSPAKIQLKEGLESRTKDWNAPSDPRLTRVSVPMIPIVAPPPSPMNIVMERAARFGTAHQPGGPGATPSSAGSTNASWPTNGTHAALSFSETRTQDWNAPSDPRLTLSGKPMIPVVAPPPSPMNIVMERAARFGTAHQPGGPGATPSSATLSSYANQGTTYRNGIPDDDAPGSSAALAEGQSIPNENAPKLTAGYINR